MSYKEIVTYTLDVSSPVSGRVPVRIDKPNLFMQVYSAGSYNQVEWALSSDAGAGEWFPLGRLYQFQRGETVYVRVIGTRTSATTLTVLYYTDLLP